VTDSTVDSDAYAAILAAHPLIQPEPEDRQRTIRRTIAWAAVVLVHILAVILLVFSNSAPIVMHIKVVMPEAIMWIPMPSRTAQPIKRQEKPQPDQPTVVIPESTAPITLPPVKHKELAPPPSEGMEGVGRSIACGASSYENLSPLQRQQCLRHPWGFIKKADGTIVMAKPADAPPPPPTTMDLMRHEQETAPPCPVLQNTPCLGGVIHGAANPLGPAAQQPF
jgi:hypothetical protein